MVNSVSCEGMEERGKEERGREEKRGRGGRGREGGRDCMVVMCVRKGPAVLYPERSGREESRRRRSTWLGVCKAGSHPRVQMAV